MKRRAALLHTNGGGTGPRGSLFGLWTGNARGDHGRDNLHVGAHFQVMRDGRAEQYVDTDLVIYHAYSASEWAVGIETEDDDHPEIPWTYPQLSTIVAILRELHVPPAQLTSPHPADGVGWHEQFREWNHEGHRCPGPERELQIRRQLLHELLPAPLPAHPHPGEDDDLVKLIQTPGDPMVFVTDFITKRHVTDPAELKVIQPLLPDTRVHAVSAAVRDAIPTTHP